jgi:hypothetical protein
MEGTTEHLAALVTGHVAEGIIDIEHRAAGSIFRLGLNHDDRIVGMDDGRFEQSKSIGVVGKAVGRRLWGWNGDRLRFRL